MVGLQKILRGVIQYRGTVRSDLLKQFQRIRDNPSPTAVFFTCMDSRMLPTRFTQSQVGDMFVVRNAGNIIPHAENYGKVGGHQVSITTEPAALEMAVKKCGIRHIIVCGHSDCKAMIMLNGLYTKQEKFEQDSPMDLWLGRHGYPSVERLEERLKDKTKVFKFVPDNPQFSFDAHIDPDDKLRVEDKLSQINTLQQLENIASHAVLSEYMSHHDLALHALWFDIYTGDVYMFSKTAKQFVIIDENTIDQHIAEVDGRPPCAEHS